IRMAEHPSGRVSSRREVSIAAIVSPDSRTEEVTRSRIRDVKEMAQAELGAETISRQTGAITSSPSVRPIGITIGTEVVIIGGMATVAVLLTARGSSTTSDSTRTIIGIRT